MDISNIEKALEKHKKEPKNNAGRVSAQERDDSDRLEVHGKSGIDNSPSEQMKDSAHDASIPYYREDSRSKLDKKDSHILSAIQKKDGESSTRQDSLISANYDQVMEDNRLVSQVLDSGRKNGKSEKLSSATNISNFHVDDHIVSYYETIGKQTWKGPVMVNFRRFQVSLSGLQRNNMCKVMLFTSSQQKEGKSTISLNTAITLASDKKRKIALVDCDFRKPSLDKLLGFSPTKGLSDYLLEEVDFKDICFHGLFPNLTLIPVGNKPSNTFELFASERMRQVFSHLKQEYDFVIIDTPPVLAFPDTVILAPLSDGVVLVVNCKNTRKKAVKRAMETLKDCKIAGFVMNMSENAAVDYYGHTSGYYYYDY